MATAADIEDVLRSWGDDEREACVATRKRLGFRPFACMVGELAAYLMGKWEPEDGPEAVAALMTDEVITANGWDFIDTSA